MTDFMPVIFLGHGNPMNMGEKRGRRVTRQAYLGDVKNKDLTPAAFAAFV